jgi:hypothetical protein
VCVVEDSATKRVRVCVSKKRLMELCKVGFGRESSVRRKIKVGEERGRELL